MPNPSCFETARSLENVLEAESVDKSSKSAISAEATFGSSISWRNLGHLARCCLRLIVWSHPPPALLVELRSLNIEVLMTSARNLNLGRKNTLAHLYFDIRRLTSPSVYMKPVEHAKGLSMCITHDYVDYLDERLILLLPVGNFRLLRNVLKNETVRA